MGALEIRRASAQLKQLGSVRMPELDTGAARAWQAQAAAAMKAGEAARVAGQAQMEGIMRRGQIVGQTLGGLGKLAMELYDRENDRIANNAVLELKRLTTESLYGNGEDKQGWLNEDIRDVGKWLSGIKDWNRRTVEDLSKDMNGEQKRLFQERAASGQLALESTIAQHAARTTIQKQLLTAKAVSADAMETAALSFSNPAAREACVDAFVKAKEGEFDVNHTPEEARLPLMREAMRGLLSKGWELSCSGWIGETANEENEDLVRKAWDEKRKLAESVGYGISSAAVKQYLPDGLTDAEKELFRQRMKSAEERAVANAHNLFEANGRRVTEEYAKKIDDFMKDDKSGDWALTVRAWADDKTLEKYNPKLSARCKTWATNLEHGFAKNVQTPKDVQGLIGRKLTYLDYLRLNGASDDEVKAMQASVVTDMRTAMKFNLMNAEAYHGLEKRVRGVLTAEKADAMRRFYRAFGVDLKGYSIDEEGRFTKAGFADVSGKIYSVPGTENGSISADELLEYGNLLETALGENGLLDAKHYKPEAVDRVISDIKVNWATRKADERRAAILDVVSEMGRGAAANGGTASAAKPAEKPGRQNSAATESPKTGRNAPLFGLSRDEIDNMID